jgi:hypothetical protein
MMSFRKVLNAVLFQTAWFAAVLGAARGIPWLGPLVLLPVVGINLAMAHNRYSEVKLLACAGAIGFLFDTALIRTGTFQPLPGIFPDSYSPPWMIGLWLNFAATLNLSLGWLQKRYLLAGIFGSFGGPLAYYSGAKLGATLTLPSPRAMVLLAIGWGVVTPLLVWLARHFSGVKGESS